jgi:ankyrin repeat protein
MRTLLILTLCWALIASSVPINVLNDKQLIAASIAGNLETVQTLVQAGASICARNIVDDTPLILAAEQGHLEIVRFLFKAGASVNERGN